jgi:hypothetical protein
MNYRTQLYRKLAQTLDARTRCFATGNDEWSDKHTETIRDLVDKFMPSGSGWDSGTQFDWKQSTPEKLVFFGSFHHMNDAGYYDGWTEHTITVRPSLQFEITLSISGRNRNDIKEHLHEQFESALTQDVDWDEETKTWKHVS